jgi:hypothetical protein
MLAGAEIRPKLPFQRLRSTADAVHRMMRQGTSQSATNTGPVRRPRDTVMSYCGHMDFGIVAHRDQMPDLWSMLDRLRDSLEELK